MPLPGQDHKTVLCVNVKSEAVEADVGGTAPFLESLNQKAA